MWTTFGKGKAEQKEGKFFKQLVFTRGSLSITALGDPQMVTRFFRTDSRPGAKEARTCC